MPLFKYKVSDKSGKISEMLIEGDSQAEAARRLQRRGVMPLEFLGEGTASAKGKGFFGGKLDVVEFTDRLVPLLEANIPLERALSIMGEGQEETAMGKVAGELRRGLHEGRKLSDLIRERGREFPQLYASVVEAGEEAGALPQVMGELRKFLLDSQELTAFIISSSVYPAFIAFAGIIMLCIVLGVIVPRFAKALAGAGINSTSVDILLGISNFFHDYWWTLLIVVGVLVWLVTQIRKENGPLRRGWDHLVLQLPLVNKLVSYTNLGRLCRTMAILMRSGVHLLNTVSIANRVIQNLEIRDSLEEISGELRQGQKISTALAKSKYIPPMMLRMVSVGEETGAVEAMLERVADRYDSDLKKLVRRLLSLFEPTVIVCLGLGVAGIVLMMFLAIMDMQSTL